MALFKTSYLFHLFISIIITPALKYICSFKFKTLLRLLFIFSRSGTAAIIFPSKFILNKSLAFFKQTISASI